MCEFDKLDNDTTITIISINYVCVYGCIYCLKQKIHVRTPCASHFSFIDSDRVFFYTNKY